MDPLQVQHFLQFVKNIYKEIPIHLNKIFEPKPILKVKDLTEVNINVLLLETYTITNIQTEKKNNDGTIISVRFSVFKIFYFQWFDRVFYFHPV